jgi:hypothetical protein
MAFPKILFLATFLLLLSFWVDVCHQGNGEEDDDDDEENSIQQVLLEKSKSKPGSSNASDRRKCCSFHGIHVGTRQKFVVAAIILVFILMISFAILIWIASGKNPMNSSLLAEVCGIPLHIDISSFTKFLSSRNRRLLSIFFLVL